MLAVYAGVAHAELEVDAGVAYAVLAGMANAELAISAGVEYAVLAYAE